MYIDEHNFAPTLREIAAGVFLSVSSAHRIVHQLELNGAIAVDRNANQSSRAIRVIQWRAYELTNDDQYRDAKKVRAYFRKVIDEAPKGFPPFYLDRLEEMRVRVDKQIRDYLKAKYGDNLQHEGDAKA